MTENFNVPVALKPIKSRVSTETDISTFLREMSILKCVRHPNIARVYGLVDEGKESYRESYEGSIHSGIRLTRRCHLLVINLC